MISNSSTKKLQFYFSTKGRPKIIRYWSSKKKVSDRLLGRDFLYVCYPISPICIGILGLIFIFIPQIVFIRGVIWPNLIN